MDHSNLTEVALHLAEARGFAISSKPEGVGRLLQILAAAVPNGGRILELGTGCGVGTSSLVDGLGTRSDVTVVSVEQDQDLVDAVRQLPWPGFVDLQLGDAVALLPELGSFDLIFPDGHGGKWGRIDLTLDAVRPGGVVLIDDMNEHPDWESWKPERKDALLATLRADTRFVMLEMDWETGLVLLTKRR